MSARIVTALAGMIGTTAVSPNGLAARLGAVAIVFALVLSPAAAAPGDPPYDADYMRLAQILGGLHHLRPLCGANEPQIWRDKMNALISAENPSPERKKRLIDEFNRSYRTFAEIYRDCTPAAEAIIDQYLAEGARISEDVLSRYGRH
jgi:uncharacterized protein (TIGR02301 family)